MKNQNTGRETNISMFYRGLRPGAFWEELATTHIAKLRQLACIAKARITLERKGESKPAFRVLAVLEVPGPDYHAEATDYTLRAALLKVIENLRRQMQARKNRQLVRLKNKARLNVFGRPSCAAA